MIDFADLYKQHVSPQAYKFKKVVLSSKDLEYIENLVIKVIPEKLKEKSHKKDCIAETKRFTNGFKGEMAVSKLLGFPIIDPNVGDSKNFDVPDIPGYVVGIKTVEYGHFPVIPKENTYPQIICICHPTSNEIVYVCGLADVDTLNKYQHGSLIIDQNLRMKGTKTGFYGFSQLTDVSLDSLKPFAGEYDSPNVATNEDTEDEEDEDD